MNNITELLKKWKKREGKFRARSLQAGKDCYRDIELEYENVANNIERCIRELKQVINIDYHEPRKHLNVDKRKSKPNNP